VACTGGPKLDRLAYVSRESAAPHPESVIRRSTLASVRWKTSGGRSSVDETGGSEHPRELKRQCGSGGQRHAQRLLTGADAYIFQQQGSSS
jgi:hypothetical protein